MFPLFDALAAAPSSLGAGLSLGPLVALIVSGWVVSAALIAWRNWAGLAGASLMGLAVSVYLGIQHHPAMGDSFCSVSSTFDCDAVNRSEYSEIFGFPIAFLGAFFYAGVIGLSFFRLRGSEAYPRAAHLVFAGSLIAIAYSVFLAWASVQLGAWCLFCISLYGVNGLLAFASWRVRREETEPVSAPLLGLLTSNGERSLGTFLTAGAVVFIGSMAYYDRIETTAQEVAGSADSTMLTRLFEATYGPLELDGTEPILGDPRAPYTVVEFADFQCPSCASAAPAVLQLVSDLPQVRVLFKHYPISDICNDKVQGARHDKACQAAAAAECARHQGKFWELEKLLFINQDALDQPDLMFMAEQVGLDTGVFGECMVDEATAKAVRKDVADAHAVGVFATPSFYLQGLRGEEWVSVHDGPEALDVLVRAHLAGTPIPDTPPAGSHTH